MKTLINKKLYIAPYSPMSKALINELKNSQFLGFIDKNAIGDDIYKIDNIKEFDFVLIYSPNHYKAIYKEYIQKGIQKDKIIIVTKDKDGFHFYNNKLLLDIKEKSIDLFKSSIIYLSSKRFLKKDRVLLISPDFVDLNIKYLFLYLKNKSIDTYLATDNKEHYKIFSQVSDKVLLYPSFKYFRIAISSKIKVIDRIVTSDIIKTTLANSFIVQLWHGIALKRLNNMNGGLKLNSVVSTSKWATKNNFSKFFESDDFFESGYPRCDVFLRDLNSDDFLLTDSDTLKFIEENSDKKVVIYMPTFRENSFNSNPIDFEILNDFCKENDIIFIFKMHPFDLLKYFDTLKEVRLSNIIFYKAGCDIYPLLKSCDLLVSDYSSVYFDFLLANKPIVHFVYDKDEYVNARGDFMLNFDEFIAGDLAISFDELQMMIIKNLAIDKYEKKREKLKRLLFDNNSLACKKLYKYIKGTLKVV